MIQTSALIFRDQNGNHGAGLVAGATVATYDRSEAMGLAVTALRG